MSRKTMAIASLLLTAAMAGVGIAVAQALPGDVRLPVHWGLDGRPDDFAGKWEALLLPAGLTALIALLFWFLPALEPRRTGLERSRGLYLSAWAALLILGPAIQLAVVSEAFGWPIGVHRVLPAAIGLMFILIGNQLGKSRSMYMMGLRTPWTLASEEVWIRTHRLAGKLMLAAGVATLAAALFAPSPDAALTVMAVSIGIAVLVPVAWSFILWRRERNAQPSE